MDIVTTNRFGSLEKIQVAEQEVITLPEGSPGLENLIEFALIDPEGGPPPIPRGSSMEELREASR